VCGEAYHRFCAPRLCGWTEPALNEESRRSWCCGLCKACERCGNRAWADNESCVPLAPPADDAAGARPDAQALLRTHAWDGLVPASSLVCELCDRAIHVACLPAGALPAAVRHYRCGPCSSYCESCHASLRRHGAPSAVGRWCVDCAPKAAHGSSCAVCVRTFDAENADSKMVFCGGCAGWVHVACDGIGAETYAQLAHDALGYFCPACRSATLACVIQQQRNLDRVVAKILGERVAHNDAINARAVVLPPDAPLPTARADEPFDHRAFGLLPPADGLAPTARAEPPPPARAQPDGGGPSSALPPPPPPAARPRVEAAAEAPASRALARREASAPRADPRCCALCGVGGDSAEFGRLLYVDADVFAHAQCLLWTSEVYERADGSLVNALGAIRRCKRTACAHCGALGASVGCDVKRCPRIFHLACAAHAGCALRPASLALLCAEHKSEHDVAHERALADTDSRATALRARERKQARQEKLEQTLADLSERDRAREVRRIQASCPDLQCADEDARARQVLAGITGGAGGPLARPLYCASRALRSALDAHAEDGALLRVGALTCYKFGEIEPLRTNGHDAHSIYPTGFVSRRRHWSTLDPRKRALYTCEIKADDNDLSSRISFQIRSADDPRFFAFGRTPLDAYSTLQKAVGKARVQHGVPNFNWYVPGGVEQRASIFFGCGTPCVRRVLQAMPGAAECVEYRPLAGSQQSEPPLPLPLSMTGCARTDGFSRSSSAFKQKYSSYLRPYLNRGAEPSLLQLEAVTTSAAAASEVNDAGADLAFGAYSRRERVRKQHRESDRLTLPEKELAMAAQHRAMRQRIETQGVKVSDAVLRGSRERPATHTRAHHTRRDRLSLNSPRARPLLAQVLRSPIHKWGLFTTIALPKDTMIIEYVGQALRNLVSDRREEMYEDSDIGRAQVR
jgi:hypothetical protein